MQLPTTIRDIAPELAAGRISAVELTTACLQQIQRLEPELQAWVELDGPAAIGQAHQLDEEQATGKVRGPLHGIPLGIKDIIDVAGFPTRCGSALSSESAVTTDATLVARLRAAGAIILGKTVTTEFACFDPPQTRNPWNAAHTPGGSSSGSAVSVATGMCLGAVGSQTGGSVTRPASYCGVASCKPTFGRIPRTGMFPVSEHLDHPGLFARCVVDLATLLNVVQEEYCPAIETAQISGSALSQSTPPRLLLCEEYFLEQTTADVVQLTRNCAERLASAGANVEVAKLPASFGDVHRLHRRIMAAEAAEVHRQSFADYPAAYGSSLAGLLREGAAISSSELQAALTHQIRFAQEMAALLSAGQILVTPATPAVAPSIETTGDPRFNSPWSYAGLPTVSFPVGLGHEGLPLALQLIGPAWAEEELFSAAAWCESTLDFCAFAPV